MNFKHKSNKLNTVSTSPIPIKQYNFKGPRLDPSDTDSDSDPYQILNQ